MKRPSRDALDLLDWYDAHRRDLPWRRTRDPYPILLSEVMSQQTRLDVVVPYYLRFMDRFPTVESLAAASEDDVLALWSGLGYYQRARRLHATARRVAELGGFPRTHEGLLDLPGVGPYTAAAVGSIAFGLTEPVLDGNVERVLCRHGALAGDPKRVALRRELTQRARDLLVDDRPGDSNQALMELGATVCTPRSPRCSDCPLAESCVAFREGRQERFPETRKTVIKQREIWLAAVARRGDRVLLAQRDPEAEVLPGAWMFPGLRLHREDVIGRASRSRRSWPADDLQERLGARFSGAWELDPEPVRVRHGITFRSLVILCHEAVVRDLPAADALRWTSADERVGLHTSSLVPKILGALESR